MDAEPLKLLSHDMRKNPFLPTSAASSFFSWLANQNRKITFSEEVQDSMVYAPKWTGGSRPAVLLSPFRALKWTACALPMAPHLRKIQWQQNQKQRVGFAYQVREKYKQLAKEGIFHSQDWTGLHTEITTDWKGGDQAFLVTDIRKCYEGASLSVLESQLEKMGVGFAQAQDCLKLAEKMPCGLPPSYSGSHILAQIMLAPVYAQCADSGPNIGAVNDDLRSCNDNYTSAVQRSSLLSTAIVEAGFVGTNPKKQRVHVGDAARFLAATGVDPRDDDPGRFLSSFQDNDAEFVLSGPYHNEVFTWQWRDSKTTKLEGLLQWYMEMYTYQGEGTSDDVFRFLLRALSGNYRPILLEHVLFHLQHEKHMSCTSTVIKQIRPLELEEEIGAFTLAIARKQSHVATQLLVDRDCWSENGVAEKVAIELIQRDDTPVDVRAACYSLFASSTSKTLACIATHSFLREDREDLQIAIIAAANNLSPDERNRHFNLFSQRNECCSLATDYYKQRAA